MEKRLITNIFELSQLLLMRHGEDLQLNVVNLLEKKGIFNYKDSKIIITFDSGKYLLISTDDNNQNILKEMEPTLNEVMSGIEPICSYNIKNKDLEEKDGMPTLEWDIKDPEERIKEIVNGKAFTDNFEVYDIVLYGERNISDYIEKKEEKISGIYPGSIANPEAFKTMNEIDLYFNIDSLGGHIWRCRHDMAHGLIPDVDLTEEEYALEYMVYQTTRFGVQLPEPQIDTHVPATKSYYAWYNFYNNYFKYELTDKEWDSFQTARRNKKDISAFIPSGNWQDLIEKQAVKTYQ